jgi:uncharacterized protein
MSKIFYHNDLDGLASCAVVRKAKLGIKVSDCFEINYGQPFPWNKIIPGEKIFMVDFCLQPFSDMERLNDLAYLIWIDHHKTALEAYNEWTDKDYKNRIIYGLREVGKAGCELTWEYCYGHAIPVPRVIKLLGAYDIWNLYADEVFEFQMGMRYENFGLDNHFWDLTLNHVSYNPDDWINSIIATGKMVIKWEDIRTKEYCKAYGIETFINGYRAIAVNVGRANSQFFLSYYDPTDYDIFIYFCRLPSNKWTVGLMANNDYVDVGEIAKGYGGGGHRGASGFQCVDLPFEI